MGYLPICYSNHNLRLPEMNWQCSVSVDMCNFEDTTPYKVLWQSEPPSIVDQVDKIIKNHKFYDLILAWEPSILSSCGNAKFFAPGAVWNQESDTSQKKFAVSFLTSSKDICEGHRYRLDMYRGVPGTVAEAVEIRGGGLEENAIRNFPYLKLFEITKHKSPPWLSDKRSLLVPFEFSIVMENATCINFFTEKVNDAFATKTIPIYYGAPNLAEFYNPEGFLLWDCATKLFEILNNLTPDFYASKKAAIDENYQRALKYADRTGNLVRAIAESWAPKIPIVYEGGPNKMMGDGL